MRHLADVTIEDTQRSLHVTAETIAVFAVAPFMFYLSAQSALPTWSRVASGLIGAATVAIDGWLLLKYKGMI